jgi:GMP synthase-like glutamine amidotransferase
MEKLKFHCIQHASFEGAAYLGEWILNNDHDLSYTRLFEEHSLPSVNSFDVLVIMGGPMSVNDTDKFKWLAKEKKFIHEAIHKKKKIIGICLGSQLLADVLGAKVFANHEKEIGFFAVQKATDHQVFVNFPIQSIIFQWHGDTFDLPKGATLLASSEACKNQAFIWNNQVLGLQFHIEVTEDSVLELIESGKDELVQATYIQQPEKIKEGFQFIPTCHIILDGLMEKFLSL